MPSFRFATPRSLRDRIIDRLAARAEGRDAIVDFFATQFVLREPFARSLGLTPASFRPMAAVIVDDALRAKHCFVTRSREGAVCGVFIVRDATVAPSGDLTELCPAAAPIHRLLAAVTASYLVDHPPVPGRTLEAMFMLVDKDIENRSTGKELWLACFVVAFLQGFRDGYACLTNPRSQRLWRSVGGDLVTSMEAGPFFRGLGFQPDGDPGTVKVGRMDLGLAVAGLAGVLERTLRRRIAPTAAV